jgi:hypothetical protein
MKKLISILMCMLVVFLAGCATTNMFQDYKAGEVKTVSVGDPMISWGSVTTNPMAGGAQYQTKTTCSLVFNGKDDKTLFIAYREFYENAAGESYAKPAFSNELKYPANTKTIKYQGHELEVVGISDGSISIKVIK